MKILFLSVLLAYFVVPGTALKCFSCTISSSPCVSTETCTADQLCFSGNINVGPVSIYSSECLDQGLCGKPVSETFHDVEIKMTTDCCDFDNCNGAAATQLSVLAISVMVLVWFVGFQ